MPNDKRTLAQKLGILLLAVVVCAATVVVSTVTGLLIGILSSSFGWVHGEASAWSGLIGAFYGILAGFVVGPIVSWAMVAGRLRVSRKTTAAVVIGLLVIIPVLEFSILHWPRMTGPSESENRVNIEAVSNDGELVIVEASRTTSSRLYKIDTRTGQATGLIDAGSDFQEGASLSPDGQDMVFVSRNQQTHSEIMLCSIDGGELRRLSQGTGGHSPMFSHDGTRVYFTRASLPERYSRGFDMYSAKLDGTDVKQVMGWSFDEDENLYSISPLSLSKDEASVLMKAETKMGERLLIYSLKEPTRKPEVIVPRIPNAPDVPVIASAYFAPGDNSIMLLAASQGAKGYDYDVYRLGIASYKLEKLTATNGYASDFRLSSNGQTAAFFTWELSRLNSVPTNPVLHILDTRTGRLSTVAMSGLP